MYLQYKMQYVREKLRARDVKDCFQTLLFTSKLIGIVPFCVTRRDGGFVTSLDILTFIHMTVSFAIYFVSFFYVMIYDETVVGHIYTSLLFKLSDKFRVIMGFIFLTFVFVDTFVGKSFHGEIVEIYTKIDNMFKLVGVNKNYDKMKMRLIILTIVYQLINIGYMILSLWLVSSWSHKPSFVMCIAMYYPGYIITSMLTLFRTNVIFIIKNLNLLNGQLTAIMERKTYFKLPVNVTYDECSETVQNKLHVIMKLFDTICHASDTINLHFTKCMLVIMAISFLSTVFNMFYVFTTLSWLYQGNHTAKLNTFLFFSIHQCLLHACNIIFAITVCETCLMKAKMTSNIINKMLIQESDERIKKKLHYFSTYMLHRYPNFSACGFFTMDNTLFFTMVGAATTYLIILIQFTLTTSLDDKLVNSTGLINLS